jgi:hypothetical protein
MCRVFCKYDSVLGAFYSQSLNLRIYIYIYIYNSINIYNTYLYYICIYTLMCLCLELTMKRHVCLSFCTCTPAQNLVITVSVNCCVIFPPTQLKEMRRKVPLCSIISCFFCHLYWLINLLKAVTVVQHKRQLGYLSITTELDTEIPTIIYPVALG